MFQLFRKMGLKGSFEGMGTLWPFRKFSFLPLSLMVPHFATKKRAGIDLLRSIPHFVPWWWGVFPKKFSCSMLVPTTTQGMSIVFLNLCLFIQFRALEFASGSAEPSFWIHFGKPELDFPLTQVCFWSIQPCWLGSSAACLSPPPHKGLKICHPPRPTFYAGQVLQKAQCGQPTSTHSTTLTNHITPPCNIT